MQACSFRRAGLSMFLIIFSSQTTLEITDHRAKRWQWQMRVLAGRPVMATAVAKMALISRSLPCALARIWSGVEGPFPSTVLQFRSYSNEGLDGRGLPPPEASSRAPLLWRFPPASSTIRSFPPYRSVYGRHTYHTYPVSTFEGYRIMMPSPVLEVGRNIAALDEAKRSARNHDRASRNSPQESRNLSPRQGFVSDTELVPPVSVGGIGGRHLANAITTNRALVVLKNRQQKGLRMDSYTLIDVLKRCSEQKDLITTRQVHDCIIQSGMVIHPRVAITLLNVYIKCARLQDARRVFDGLQKTDRNILTWNVLIGAFAKSGSGAEAYRLFLEMNQEGFIPDAITYLSILNPSAQSGAFEWVKDVHSYALKAGMESDVRVGTVLVRMYAKCGSLDEARLVFDRMENRDVITWNVMIGAYSGSGCGVEAYQLFDRMKREGFVPNAVTCVNILNGSASLGASEWVKEVHLHALKTGLESDLRVGNALVHMYGKSGSIDAARLVFDKMENRDVITWNAMIGAYAECGCGEDAYGLFGRMEREGFKPDAFTYASILNPAASAGALEWVKEVHNHALKAGLESHLHVGNALVRMYSKCGSMHEAQRVFDKMDKRDVVTWNIIIGAYAESGNGLEAYRLFVKMTEAGSIPDAFTYAGILNAAASLGALEWVTKVHSHALKAGLESDVRVGTALVRMYAKSGSIDDARLVFDRMEKRDVITWNVMIGAYADIGGGMEAYNLFDRMESEGFVPNAFTYASILNAAAAGAGALEWVREIHSHAFEAGLESDVRVGNALVHMYAKSGSIKDARLVFDRMGKRDVVTWNVMIGAYADSGCGVEAYRLFVQMEREGFIPNAFTYVSLVNAAPKAGALEWVREIHIHALKAGMESHSLVGTALVRMYTTIGKVDEGRQVFDKMENRDLITWNVMIGACAKAGCGAEAYALFAQMEREGFIPDTCTYASLLNAAASAGALEWVKKVHNRAMETGLASNLGVGNALVHMYAKSGSIDDARIVFDRMETRDVITWNVMIGGLAQHGLGQEALELFKRMKADCTNPDEITLVAVLSACSHAGLVEDGRRLFRAMKQEYGVEPTVVHYNCMVDGLGRAGHLDEAKLLIDSMPMKPDAVTWTALLGACRTHCNVELGELAAEEVFKLEPSDAAAYVLLSNIYAATGRWEKVVSVRNMMQKRGVWKDQGRSWIAVDNKVHEFVAGDTSHPESTAIYSLLEDLTEKLKGKGYSPDTSLVHHHINDADKELALCSHSEKLAIAYGLLRAAHGDPIRIEKNLRICTDCHAATKLISEVTGREIIAKDANRFHHFRSGVCSCGDYW